MPFASESSEDDQDGSGPDNGTFKDIIGVKDHAFESNASSNRILNEDSTENGVTEDEGDSSHPPESYNLRVVYHKVRNGNAVKYEREEIMTPIVKEPPTVMERLQRKPSTRSRFGLDYDDLLPEWGLMKRSTGVFQDGLIGVVVGHKGCGKSRTLQKLSNAYVRFIDKGICFSSTDVKNGQFGRSGIIHPAAIQTEPTMEDVDYIRLDRRAEMDIWEERYVLGEYYRPRTLLCYMDDAGYASDVLGKRSKTMLDMFTNNRHMGLHMWLSLQQAGLLNKTLRANVDIAVIVREYSGEALGSIYDTFFKYNTTISPAVMRDMIDCVCIKGQRALVWDARAGKMFKITLDFDEVRLPRPIGNRAFLEWCDERYIPLMERARARENIKDLVRSRYAKRDAKKGGRKNQKLK